MIIKTVRHVYVLMCENAEEETTTTIGVYSEYEKALEAKQRLQAVATFDDYYTISSAAIDDFTYVEQEEERYAEVAEDYEH